MSVDQGNPTELSELDDLYDLDWIPVPNVPYIMKYFFCDTGYNVLVSNLTSLYGEKMAETDIEARFTELNPHVKMKSQVILENLKNTLKKCLTDPSNLVMKLDENRVTIALNILVSHALCKYDIEMSLMPADKIMHYIIGPTVLGALLSQRKVFELQKKISPVANSKQLVSAITVSAQNAIEPDWLKGKNVPAEIICNSFLTIQNHFKNLYAENYEAFSSRKTKAENVSIVHSVSLHKRSKLLENNYNQSSVNFEEEDGCNLIKKDDKTNTNVSSLEPPRKAAKKKKVFKF